jgi:hypothetical protein
VRRVRVRAVALALLRLRRTPHLPLPLQSSTPSRFCCCLLFVVAASSCLLPYRLTHCQLKPLDQMPNLGAARCALLHAGRCTGGLCLCPTPWGARWTPPRSHPSATASAIKCHQKSTSNSAGSSVGSLAPPMPPRGWAVRPGTRTNPGAQELLRRLLPTAPVHCPYHGRRPIPNGGCTALQCGQAEGFPGCIAL